MMGACIICHERRKQYQSNKPTFPVASSGSTHCDKCVSLSLPALKSCKKRKSWQGGKAKWRLAKEDICTDTADWDLNKRETCLKVKRDDQFIFGGNKTSFFVILQRKKESANI